MIPLSLGEIASVVGGQVVGDPSLVVTGDAFLDTRRPVAGGLFVAIAGERVDGHDFAAAAVAGGGAAVLASRPTPVPTVVVADAAVALGRLARHVLDAVRPQVLALTGSQGKTGTKDLLGQTLGQISGGPRGTVATAGNLNNELGVPLTVLRTTHATRHLVVEMGARGPGHISELCRIAPPDVAAVLNVGTAHLGEFGSREAIALAKGEIIEALPSTGTAVLNADDALVLAMRARTDATVLTCGLQGEVTWRGLALDDLGRPSFELGHAGSWFPVSLRQPGAHQVANAAAAGAMALAAGAGLREVASGLTAALPASRWRMELHERADGLVVLNDSYNANPASMAAALDALVAIGERRGIRTVAVLGEMLELGDSADAEHERVGRYAAEQGADAVVAVGGPAALLAAGAASVEGWGGIALTTAGRDDALAWVRENVAAPAVVLVKASRGAALETVAEGLLEGEDRDR